MEKTFTKKDLRSGYLVEFRNGHRRLVTRAGMFTQILVNPNTGAWNYLASNWNDDLTAKTGNNTPMCAAEHLAVRNWPKEYDIMRVWGLVKETARYGEVFLANPNGRELLYQRREAKKLTVNEISKLLGYEVEIVGEDE